MTNRGKTIKTDEHDLFEAAGARLHKWGERDYERNYLGQYTWTTQRQAWEIWCAARGLHTKSTVTATDHV